LRIVSEVGGKALLVNPWATGAVRLFKNGADAGSLNGAELSLDTAKVTCFISRPTARPTPTS